MDKRPLIDRLRDCAGAWADFDYEADAAVCYEAADRIAELESGLRELAMIGENVTDEVRTLANDLVNKRCKHRDDGQCIDCIVVYLVDSLTAPFILKIEALQENELCRMKSGNSKPPSTQ